MSHYIERLDNDNYFEISYLETDGLIYTNWIGKDLTVKEVMIGSNLMLDYIKKYKATSMINDNRKLTGVWDEANEWIANVWTPQALSLGFKRISHIVSNELYAQSPGELMVDQCTSN